MTAYDVQPEHFPAPAPLPPDAPAVECDVLVVGGGPAGSTAAALLAMRGIDVLLLEKKVHPRFHIGESLLPRNLEQFDLLGIRDQVAALGLHKGGGEFVSDETGGRVTFDFADSLNKDFTYSFQVPRGPFDELLFKTAAARGARTMEAIRVTDVAFGASGERARVTAVESDGRTHLFAPRYVLDASGRDTLLAAKLGTKVADKTNNTAAVYAHYRGVAASPQKDGYVSIHLARDGWFWMIPLPGDVMSVGFVGTQAAFRQRGGASMEAFLEQRIRMSPTAAARMHHAERISAVTGTGNYSYRASSAVGDGYMLIGDAFAFLDPVFSSGVLLAMTGGQFGAEVAASWLQDARAGQALAAKLDRRMRRGMATISWVIHRINDPVMRHMFMNPHNKFGMRDGLVALLAGNLEIAPRARLPVLAFKAVFYVMTAVNRVRPWLPEPPPDAVGVAAE